MFKIAIGVTVALVLSGCASVVASTPKQVIVRAGSAMTGEALKIAQAECEKKGLNAVYSGRPMPNEFVYDCVK
jgi:uncharacterized protein YceK